MGGWIKIYSYGVIHRLQVSNGKQTRVLKNLWFVIFESSGDCYVHILGHTSLWDAKTPELACKLVMNHFDWYFDMLDISSTRKEFLNRFETTDNWWSSKWDKITKHKLKKEKVWLQYVRYPYKGIIGLEFGSSE